MTPRQYFPSGIFSKDGSKVRIGALIGALLFVVLAAVLMHVPFSLTIVLIMFIASAFAPNRFSPYVEGQNIFIHQSWYGFSKRRQYDIATIESIRKRNDVSILRSLLLGTPRYYLQFKDNDERALLYGTSQCREQTIQRLAKALRVHLENS
jgi:hypothetical protein